MKADAATVGGVGEDALVRRITETLPTGAGVIAGAGDDCAVLEPAARGEVVFLKTDCIVQDVHFTLETEPARVGHKAMARVISDIAAMGGTPRHALVTLIMPPSTALSYVDGLYAGMNAVAAACGASIVGGETSRGPLLIISVAMTGSAKAGRWLSRSGAKAGDWLLVTGRLGGSLGGHHLDFTPRLPEAQWLAQNARIHAMMDLSDGLAKDLPRLASASGVGFRVEPMSIPVREGCTLQQACGDGEDYELLFAASPATSRRLLKLWPTVFPQVPLSCIGRALPQEEGQTGLTPEGGWDHFTS